MNVYKASNIPLRLMRKFLSEIGAKPIRIKGDHEIWAKREWDRSVPLPCGISTKKFWEMMGKKKGTTKRKATAARKGKRSKKK